MADFRYKAGLGNVGSYQVSGTPWITGSGAGGLAENTEIKVTFPRVTKSVMVLLDDSSGNDNIHVHFASSGSDANIYDGRHFFPLINDRDSVTFNVKCKEIWISNPPPTNGGDGTASGFIVVAELTGIDPAEMFPITGSGITDPTVPAF